ncbi:MAG: hypothetical protein IJQ76_07160 [Prevotella sp.]|nr:hypothetical protein [Prevotella sp.]
MKASKGTRREGQFYTSYYNHETDEYETESYDYEYTYNYSVVMTKKGLGLISDWGYNDAANIKSYFFDRGESKGIDHRDGTYTFNTSVIVYSNYKLENWKQKFSIYPFFYMKGDLTLYAPEEIISWTQDLEGNISNTINFPK